MSAETVSGAFGNEDAGEEEDDHAADRDVVVKTEPAAGSAGAVLGSAVEAESDDDCVFTLWSVWLSYNISSKCLQMIFKLTAC